MHVNQSNSFVYPQNKLKKEKKKSLGHIMIKRKIGPYSDRPIFYKPFCPLSIIKEVWLYAALYWTNIVSSEEGSAERDKPKGKNEEIRSMAGVFQERVEQELAISHRLRYYWNHRHQILFRPYWSVALRFIFLCFIFVRLLYRLSNVSVWFDDWSSEEDAKNSPFAQRHKKHWSVSVCTSIRNPKCNYMF